MLSFIYRFAECYQFSKLVKIKKRTSSVGAKPIHKEEFLPTIILNRKRRALLPHPYTVGGTPAKPQEFPHMVMFNHKYIQRQDRYNSIYCCVLL